VYLTFFLARHHNKKSPVFQSTIHRKCQKSPQNKSSLNDKICPEITRRSGIDLKGMVAQTLASSNLAGTEQISSPRLRRFPSVHLGDLCGN
jgi:hypothetical protein